MSSQPQTEHPNPEGLVSRLTGAAGILEHGPQRRLLNEAADTIEAQEKRLTEVEGDLRDAECRPLLGELELALRRAESAEQQLERVREGDG